MAKVTGFLEHERVESSSISPNKRLRNFEEFILPFSERILNEQANYKKLKSAENNLDENNIETQELSKESEEIRVEDKKAVAEI